MLQGASAGTPKPAWMIEITVAEHQPRGCAINPTLESTFTLFWAQGYESWTAEKASRLVTPDEVAAVVRTEHDTFATHNFLFVERGANATSPAPERR